MVFFRVYLICLLKLTLPPHFIHWLAPSTTAALASVEPCQPSTRSCSQILCVKYKHDEIWMRSKPSDLYTLHYFVYKICVAIFLFIFFYCRPADKTDKLE